MYTSLVCGSGDFFQSRFNVKIHVLVHFTIVEQFYVNVNVELYVHINVELFLHAFVYLYGEGKQVFLKIFTKLKFHTSIGTLV